MLRLGYALAAAVGVVMVMASGAGVFVHGLYADGAWGREALRGGDLVSLVVAAPLLFVALVLSVRGSTRAQPVLVGMLVYAVYNYAFAAFGAAFNDAFLLHILAFSMGVYALVCIIPNLDLARLARGFRLRRAATWIGGAIAIVGLLQAGLWVTLIVRNAITGAVLHDIPVAGQHLVFALDLGLSMPALVIGGVLLLRHHPMGIVVGTAVAVMGAVYQVNLMVAGVFQANADVAGVTAFAPESILLTSAFLVMAAVLVLGTRTPER